MCIRLTTLGNIATLRFRQKKIVAYGAQKTRTHTLKSIIGQFFVENGQGEAVTVDGDRYRTMFNEFLFTKIEESIDNIWFQQDGAT